MNLDHLLAFDVTIVHPATTTDRYNRENRDFNHATTVATKGWWSQRSSIETDQGRENIANSVGLFLAADADIHAGDRVILDGDTWDVDGIPMPAHTPRGVHHLEVSLRRSVG